MFTTLFSTMHLPTSYYIWVRFPYPQILTTPHQRIYTCQMHLFSGHFSFHCSRREDNARLYHCTLEITFLKQLLPRSNNSMHIQHDLKVLVRVLLYAAILRGKTISLFHADNILTDLIKPEVSSIARISQVFICRLLEK